MTKATRTSSQRKAEANRRNASKSTGPRTARGKAWSRLNALKHGILASQVVITTIEGRDARRMFEATVAGLAQDFQPVGTYEQLLVQEIAACFWRQRRLHAFENRASFDAIEIPAAAIVERGTKQLIPWKEPLYTEGGQMTTAEQIYKHAGLDAVTLPNEKDTLRVIRYEAALTRSRERAVRSLREMQKARRGMATPRAETAPVIDRAAARRNARAAQAKILSPWFSIAVWQRIREEREAAILAEDTELRERMEGEFGKHGETKPKTLDVEEIKRSLYRAINGCEMPEEPAATPAAPENDPDKPPRT